MTVDDRHAAKVSGVQSRSSSVQSTPERYGHEVDCLRSSDLQELSKSSLKRHLLQTCSKEKKQKSTTKNKMPAQKVTNKISKNLDSKKSSLSVSCQAYARKQDRKGDNPTRLILPGESSPGNYYSTSWVCKNSACWAVIAADECFCKRCSCSICHLFDDNKDPSLWLVCESDSESKDDSCGSSCHIECALRQNKAGVVNLGQFMELDGSYCCASCGKVSGILGCWKKQLTAAKDARRVDTLCYRIDLSCKLLEGTLRFNDLHKIVKEAKIKLEAELGPLHEDSDKMARGIVSRLSVATDVQNLCSDAIEKANCWLTKVANRDPTSRVDSLPAACRFLFEEVNSSSVEIVLIEIPIPGIRSVKGYKLWYSRSQEEAFSKEPICTFPRERRRILVSNLQPCVEYTFRIVSYMDSGDLGHSEAKLFTKSVEIDHKKPHTALDSFTGKKENLSPERNSMDTKENLETAQANGASSSDFKVRDLGKISDLAHIQQMACVVNGICNGDVEHCTNSSAKFEAMEDNSLQPATRGLDLNVSTVPDLNEDLNPPFDSSRDEDNGYSLGRPLGPDDDAASQGIQKNNGQPKISLKRSASPTEDALDSDSTLVNVSPSRGPGGLDENFEYCVKIIRWLECGRHIKQEFRLKLLTWFSLRSTEQERRVVNTFIQTLIDDPKSLAGQLVDSFSDIISRKRAKYGCSAKF